MIKSRYFVKYKLDNKLYTELLLERDYHNAITMMMEGYPSNKVLSRIIDRDLNNITPLGITFHHESWWEDYTQEDCIMVDL